MKDMKKEAMTMDNGQLKIENKKLATGDNNYPLSTVNYQLKKGWEIKELGDVIEIKNGKNQQSVLSETGKYKIMGSAGNVMGYANDFICEAGTTIIGRKGNISKPIYIDERFWNVDTAFGFYPKNETEIDKRLIYYLCLGIDFQSMNRGTTIPSLVKSELQKIPIYFPKSLPEQQRIIAILDEAFAAIAKAKANAEQNLKNAKQLFESYLQGVFENKGERWKEKLLGEVCEFTQGIQRDVKLQSENQKSNQVRFLRIVDFTQGNEPPRYIDNPGDKYILNSNDVSLVRYGASTGFVCRGLEGALANNLFRVIPKSKKAITNDFLFIYLTAPVFQNVIKESMNGAAMPAISFGLIKDIPFPIISIEEQQTIVEKLDALSIETKKLEAIYQQKINDLEELKKSVLQKAFSGELKVSESGLAGLKDEQDS